MDEMEKLLGALKESAPQLVAGLTPAPLSLAQRAGAARRLLAESLVDAAGEGIEPAPLAQAVRVGPAAQQPFEPALAQRIVGGPQPRPALAGRVAEHAL